MLNCTAGAFPALQTMTIQTEHGGKRRAAGAAEDVQQQPCKVTAGHAAALAAAAPALQVFQVHVGVGVEPPERAQLQCALPDLCIWIDAEDCDE